MPAAEQGEAKQAKKQKGKDKKQKGKEKKTDKKTDKKADKKAEKKAKKSKKGKKKKTKKGDESGKQGEVMLFSTGSNDIEILELSDVTHALGTRPKSASSEECCEACEAPECCGTEAEVITEEVIVEVGQPQKLKVESEVKARTPQIRSRIINLR